MISHMTDTTSARVGLEIDELRGTAGSGALGRVLTLIIVARTEGGVRDALSAAAGASRAHPSRVIVVLNPQENAAPAAGTAAPAAGGSAAGTDATGAGTPGTTAPGTTGSGAAAANDPAGSESRLDAEIRTGSEAGASEIVILRPRGAASENMETLITPLLLPDTPIVAWWIQDSPACPARTDVGRMAQRRITTSRTVDDPIGLLRALGEGYEPGDTDLAWPGVTLWRNHIAAMLDEFVDREIASCRVAGNLSNASTQLMAAWLRLLAGKRVHLVSERGTALNAVAISFTDGQEVSLQRSPGTDYAVMHRPGRHDQAVSLPRRSIEAMLIEDLRDLNPDPAYAKVLTEGLVLLHAEDETAAAAS